MTTWTDQNTIETGWGQTLNTTQIILFLNNEFIFNYDLVDINGRSIKKWNKSQDIETAWAES